MITVRKASERGYFDFGWLKTSHTFSFSQYYDPQYMGFGSLRVINEDWVGAGTGFPTHPHRDMEIISYVLAGGLEHKDSMGNGSIIRPGEVQRMSAGTGVSHSEFNPSKTEPVRLLQIWILPEKKGLKPEYEQRSFAKEEKIGKLRLIASQDGQDGSVTVHQDLKLYDSLLLPNQEASYQIATGRQAWLQVISGAITVNGIPLETSDGAAISNTATLNIQTAQEKGDFLLFDMA